MTTFLTVFFSQRSEEQTAANTTIHYGQQPSVYGPQTPPVCVSHRTTTTTTTTTTTAAAAGVRV